jgi:hypothetical protein
MAINCMLPLPSGDNVLLFRDPDLSLVVIADNGNMGPHLIRLIHEDRMFTTCSLLGGDETICEAVRFLAPHILRVNEDSETLPVIRDKTEVLVSMCLRNRSREVLKAIATELQKHNNSPATANPCGE